MSSELEQFQFRLPDPGEGLTEAELVEWYVAEGDNVREDEPLCDVETDKAVVEIPIPCSGTVEELVAAPGDLVQVGEVVAVFETANPPRQQEMGESASEPDGDDQVATATDDGAAGTAQTAASPPETDDRTFAAPSTRRYAREQGVDLAAVEGTGPGGRILREDVDRHREAGETDAESSAPATELSTDRVTEPAADSVAAGEGQGERKTVIEPLQGLRRTIAENMQQSWQEIPHVTSGFEADATDLVALKERLDEKHDIHITYTAILVKAVIPALQEFPLLNASIDMEAGEIHRHQAYNIGVATHTEDGLVVPVIKHADRKSLLEVAEELQETVEATRKRRINPADLQAGTFTITNTGSHGGHGTFNTPIIRHPEAAIMGVGAIEEQTVPVDGEVTVQDRIRLTLSFDHRLVDGVTAGQFTETIIEGIEDPDLLLSRL